MSRDYLDGDERDLVEARSEQYEEHSALASEAKDNIMSVVAQILDPGSPAMTPKGVDPAAWITLSQQVFAQIKGALDQITEVAAQRIHASEKESMRAITQAMDALSKATMVAMHSIEKERDTRIPPQPEGWCGGPDGSTSWEEFYLGDDEGS